MKAIKLTKRGKYYYYPVQTNERKTRMVSTRCTSREEALEVLSKSGAHELNQAGKVSRLTARAVSYITVGRRVTISGAIAAFEGRMRLKHAIKHAYNAAVTVRAWMTHAGAERSSPASITADQIDAFINRKSPTKASTRRVALSHLRLFFDFCTDNGWSSTHPANLVEVNMALLTHEQKESLIVEPYTDEEVEEFKAAIIKHQPARHAFWLAAVTIASSTGLRLSDIACLEWDCFSVPGFIIVHTAKTNKRVAPKVGTDLKALVDLLPRVDPRYVFPEERLIAIDARKRAKLSVWFARLCKRLKVPYRRFHALRHSHATSRAAAGENIIDIARDLGHSNTNTTKGYIHK